MASSNLARRRWLLGVIASLGASAWLIPICPSMAQQPRDVVGCEPIRALDRDVVLFLSINRFERKKNIGLAIRALALLVQQLRAQGRVNVDVRLAIAGGYDDRVIENVQHHRELRDEAERLGLRCAEFPDVSADVFFVKSFSEAQRTALIDRARALVYTPEGEHFGIVPIEAMCSQRPVIAVDSGGPRESVQHGETGFLCNNTADEFAKAMRALLDMSAAQLRQIGRRGLERVEQKFSLRAFAEELDRLVREMAATPAPRLPVASAVLVGLFTVLIFSVILFVNRLRSLLRL